MFGQQPSLSSTQTTTADDTNITIDDLNRLAATDPKYNVPDKEGLLDAINQDAGVLEEVQGLLQGLPQKSEPMLNFNATKGDELLKGIKDKFWQQGY